MCACVQESFSRWGVTIVCMCVCACVQESFSRWGVTIVCMCVCACVQESFTDVNHWVEDTDRYAKDEICKILVGNKSDLKSERTVTSDKGKVCD